jgi:TrmH family RNA methyltransferase
MGAITHGSAVPGAPAVGPRAATVLAARRLLRPSSRRDEGLFLAEGHQAVEAAYAAGALTELFVGETALGRHDRLVRECAAGGVPVRLVTDAAAVALSETVTPQGLVGVATLPHPRLADLTAPTLVAVCVAVNDPGNAGTVIRTADAAGADAVVFTAAGVDPFGGKCVRSSAGSLFHLPVIVEPELDATLVTLRALGVRVLATSGSGSTELYAAAEGGALDGPTGWLFGNEAHGLPAGALAAADGVVRVPVYGQAESLNLAVATALCLYASARAQTTARSGNDGAGGGGRR